MISPIEYMKEYPLYQETENGAIGYTKTTSALLDMNFKVSFFRNQSDISIAREFTKAYYEDPKYAVKWLFFLRDIKEGLGERRTFRVCMKYLACAHKEVARAVMELIPVYGRYDDLLIFLETDLKNEVGALIGKQLEADLAAMKENKPISLLAKWLPSNNTSSEKSRKSAYLLASLLQMNARTYRKTLSALRAYANVTEVKMSASEWDTIEYEAVPAKASMRYTNAFEKNDLKRYEEYLQNVILGNAKMNAAGIMPYEVTRRFFKDSGQWERELKDDLLGELMWKRLREQGFQNDWGFGDCIVVADGSGSMDANVSGQTSVRAIDVCNSLAIYFAEQLKGIFHNKAITFSMHPIFIDLEPGKKLREKLEIMYAHNEIANTNIEAVFELLLSMATSNQIDPKDLPKQVLIISDMEFDDAVGCYGAEAKMRPLLEQIEEKYKASGYPLPRLIFWNVCGRTNTIPMVDNENGLCLLSGFSQNAMKIAAEQKWKDPYQSLIAVLDKPRYDAVEKAVNKVINKEMC